MSAVLASKKEWNACLAKSGGAAGKCEKYEKELRSVSKAVGVDACVDETINLMKCTSGKSRANGCASVFLAMRECNRAGGKQLMAEGDGFAVAPGNMGLFVSAASSLAQSAAPVRSLEGMTTFGEEYAKNLGITPGQVRF
ncbi:unnamed protein product, partial [Polarella glacialis]|mmetsp:Transcript_81632/g.147457  ORF Transcript_81632/g.147457 Transcript_81632/m.147457 type:complete len:140 (-) Transcript_81632:55-474(-)